MSCVWWLYGTRTQILETQVFVLCHLSRTDSIFRWGSQLKGPCACPCSLSHLYEKFRQKCGKNARLKAASRYWFATFFLSQWAACGKSGHAAFCAAFPMSTFFLHLHCKDSIPYCCSTCVLQAPGEISLLAVAGDDI